MPALDEGIAVPSRAVSSFNSLSPVISIRRTLLQGEKPANFLVIGPQGAGASSLLNALFSALGSRIHTLSASAPGVKGATKRFCSYQLSSSVFLSEAWGWTADNYSRDEVQLMLQGRLSNGFVCSAKLDVDALYKSLVPLEKASLRAIDVALVVVNVKEVNAERAKAMLQQIRDRGVRILIAVTHLDEEDPKFRTNARPSSPAIEAALSKVAAVLSVDRQHVWPVLPYVAEAHCTEKIDLLNLRFLTRAIDLSVDVRAERRNDEKRG